MSSSSRAGSDWRSSESTSGSRCGPGLYTATTTETFMSAGQPRTRASGRRPLLGRRLGLLAREQQRAVDEPDVAEGLREVADETARARVVLLGEQADVIDQAEQAL